ncbi:MAG: hypothetical protein AAF738_08985, partial [Bacteroidota bacterium]
RISDILDKSYTKAQLDTSFKTPVRIFITQHESFLRSEGIPNRILNLAKEKRFGKKTLSDMCAVPFRNEAIFNKFRETLVDDVRKVLDALVWVKSIHERDIKEKLNIEICTEEYKTRYGGSAYLVRVLKSGFNIFQSINHAPYYGTANYSLFLTPELRKLLFNYYEKPEHAHLQPLDDEALKTTTHQYSSGEIDIHLELGRIAAYVSQGQVKVTAKGRPSASTLGKMQRKLNLREFFDEKKIDKTEKSLKNVRTKLLAGMAVTLASKQVHTDIAYVLREEVFKKNFLKRFDSPPTIMAHLKGMSYLESHDFRPVEVEAFSLLSRLPLQQWISIANLEDYITYNIIDLAPVTTATASNKLYFEYAEDPDSDQYYMRYARKHYIDSGTFDAAILKPYLKGLFFFYAAFGLVKIKYNQPDASELGRTTYSPYDQLKYVQLTPLGYYVTRQTNTYVQPKGSTESNILLSEDSLTILVDAEDLIAPTLLEPYAERVSSTRYKTDFRFFLKECRSKKELEGKIKLFQQFISNELPVIWQKFFAELRQKIDPFVELKDLKIFKIPTDNPALVQLIARDSLLKKIVIKAEGYHVLIPRKEFARFKKRLQEFGYFLTT